MPALVEFFWRDPLEVSFVYPSPDRPRLDIGTHRDLIALVFASQLGLFVLSIMTGVAILQKQRWAWYVGIGVHVVLLSVYLVAVYLLPPYATNDRIASMVIGGASLYLLSREDVRTYLKVIKRL